MNATEKAEALAAALAVARALESAHGCTVVALPTAEAIAENYGPPEVAMRTACGAPFGVRLNPPGYYSSGRTDAPQIVPVEHWPTERGTRRYVTPSDYHGPDRETLRADAPGVVRNRADKAPEVIARDIARRFIPGYAAIRHALDRMLADRYAAEDARTAAIAGMAARLGLPDDCARGTGHGATLTVYANWHATRGPRVEIGSPDPDAGTVSVRLDNVPAELAEKFAAEILARYATERAETAADYAEARERFEAIKAANRARLAADAGKVQP